MITAEDRAVARVIPITEGAKQLTAETAREIREMLQRFTDPDAQEMLIRCALHTYHAQRIGDIS